MIAAESHTTRFQANAREATSLAVAARALLFGALLTPLCSAGCQSFGTSSGGLFSRRGDEAATEDIRLAQSDDGPESRGALNRLNIFRSLRKAKETELQPTPPEAMDDYDAAQALFNEERYADAHKAFKATSKKYQNTPIVEDCQFMMAECLYADKRYSWAQDGYEKLMEKYPSTRHLDTCTRRLFAMAQFWLNEPTFATKNELQQVNLDDKIVSPLPAKEPNSISNWPIVPNLTDRTRPVFDTQGRALEALRKIWLHDPTGPLADDALMLSASHYLRKGDYREADRMLTLLREEYPKSPHIEVAFELGPHVKLMSYQGANYDVRNLEDAEQLKKASLRMFGDKVDRERVERELKEIEEAKALREWEKVEFWLRTNKPHSAAIYCKILLQSYPDSPYAAKARETLAKMGDEAVPPDLRPKQKSFWSFKPTRDASLDEIDEPEDEMPEDHENDESENAGLRRLTPQEAGRVSLKEIPADEGDADDSGTATLNDDL